MDLRLSLKIILTIVNFQVFNGDLLAQIFINPNGKDKTYTNKTKKNPPRNYSSISQNFLDSVKSVQKDYPKPYYKVHIPMGFLSGLEQNPQKIYVKLGNGEEGIHKGRLVAVDNNGIYLYIQGSDKFRFIDYSKIDFIRRGLILGDKIVRDVFIGAFVGALGGAILSESFDELTLLYAFAGGLAGGFYTPVITILPELIIHGIQNQIPGYKTKIDYNKLNFWAYIDMVDNDRERYGSQVLYSDFPRFDDEDKEMVNAISAPISVTQFDTSDINQMNPQSSILTETTSQNETELGPFKEGPYISFKWMYSGFESQKVDVNAMNKRFPNLRFDRLSEGDLKEFKNTSEIQYAALSICAQIGYDFRNKVTLSENQEFDLAQSLPMYNVVVVDDKTIMNAPGITSVDKDNLQLLYDLLRKRNRG